MECLAVFPQMVVSARYQGLGVMFTGMPAVWTTVCALFLVAAPATAEPRPLSEAEYEELTEQYTSGRYTAEELRRLAGDELDRIRSEFRGVMAEAAFDGTLADFFKYLRTDDRFYLPDTDAGRAAYLQMAMAITREMEDRLAEIIDLPGGSTPLEISAALDGFNSPAVAVYQPGNGRGGAAKLLFDLSDMRSAPTFQLAAITYHEGLPGHHLQVNVHRSQPNAQMGLTLSVPGFTEGWAHYAERLPSELGLYQDPYANAGRLGLEIWRVARLAADIGLALDGWSREEAINFMLENTPLSERQASLEIDRCIERPASTSTYIVGRHTISKLRQQAEIALGPDFDLRAFHNEVLKRGPIPLLELEKVIDRWLISVMPDR